MTPQPNRWTSRPFLLTLASLVTMAAGVAVIFGAPPEKANAIAGLIMSGLGAVAVFNGFELTKDKAAMQASIQAVADKAHSESMALQAQELSAARQAEAQAKTRQAALEAETRRAEAAATIEVAKVAAVAEKATAAATVDVAEVEAGQG